METPAEFTHNGTEYRGLMHVPEGNRRQQAVLFLNSGLVCRTGPDRLYVDLARRLCRRGFSSLRFDFPGIGHSGGELADVHMDMFSDTSCTGPAIDLLLERSGAESVLALGTCTGARSAVWTARRDTRVSSLALLSMPITYDRTRIRTRQGRQRYHTSDGRPFMAEFTARVKAGPFAEIVRTIVRSGRAVRDRLDRFSRRTMTIRNLSEANDQDPVLREGIYRSCTELIGNGRRILFVYGRNDKPLLSDFARHFPPEHPLNGKFDISFVDDAGHSFYGFAPHDFLLERIPQWAEQVETQEIDA